MYPRSIDADPFSGEQRIYLVDECFVEAVNAVKKKKKGKKRKMNNYFSFESYWVFTKYVVNVPFPFT